MSQTLQDDRTEKAKEELKRQGVAKEKLNRRYHQSKKHGPFSEAVPPHGPCQTIGV